MPKRKVNYPTTIGFRATQADHAKLERLCRTLEQPPGQILRLLLRLAEPTGLPPLRLGPTPDPEEVAT